MRCPKTDLHRSLVCAIHLALAAATGLAASACSSESHDEHRGPEFHFGPAPAAPHAVETRVLEVGESAAPGVREDGTVVSAVKWFDGSVEQALDKAKASGKLVFIDVGAYWCPPCHELDEKTFVDERVGEWLETRAIAVHVDAEKGEGPELVSRYHIQAYPTLLMLDASGVEKGRLVDFIEPDALLPKLDELAKGGNVLADLEAAVEATPEDLEARYRLAHAYALSARRDDAERAFTEILMRDVDNAKGYAAKVVYDVTFFFTYKLEANPEAAISAFRQLQQKFPDSPQARQAHRKIGRALCDLGRPDEAVTELEAMVASDPTDVDLLASFGWFAFRQNCRPDAGLKAVLSGIERAPDNAELRYLEAELRRLLDEPGPALAAIQTASELEPDSAYYRRQVQRFAALAGAPPAAPKTAPE